MIHTLEQQAFGAVSGDNQRAVPPLGKCSLARVEAQPGHALFLVRTMAPEAEVRQDGADFAVEINLGPERAACEPGRKRKNDVTRFDVFRAHTRMKPSITACATAQEIVAWSPMARVTTRSSPAEPRKRSIGSSSGSRLNWNV